MRIAYVHYLERAETACNHVRQFAEAARALGHEVTVHALNFVSNEGHTGTGWPGMRSGLRKRLRRHLHEPRELCRNLTYIPHETRILRTAPPDVVLVRDYLTATSCVPVSRWLGLPLVLEINAPAAAARLYEDEYWHVPGVTVWLQTWKVRHAQEGTVVSSALRDYFVQRHGVSPQKLTVVPNGADTDLFRPDSPVHPKVRAWAGQATVIGFVGSFRKWHGASLLADLMKQILRLRPHARFVVVGDGPEDAVVRSAVATCNGRALFLGRVPHAEVPSLVAAFDIAVMPESNFFGSPLKVIESMAAGKAVVAPDYGPLRDVIDDGVHGLLFRPGDLEALVSAVLRLVDDVNLRRALGAAAGEHTRASLTWRDNARRVLDVCERARRSGRPGATGAP